MKTVFISHINEDRDRAYALVESLKEANIECWRSNLEGGEGDGLQSVDQDQITQCDFFLPIYSRASLLNKFLFHEALNLARQVAGSPGRDYNYLIPLVYEEEGMPAEDPVHLNMIRFFPMVDIGVATLLQAMERKWKPSDLLVDWLIAATGNGAGSVVAQYFKTVKDMLAGSLGEAILPPERNMTFRPRQFPEGGGRMGGFLDPNSGSEQIVKLRQYALKHKMAFAPFFVSAQGELLGKGEARGKIHRLKPITLDVPANTALVFIGLGKPSALEKVWAVFGREGSEGRQPGMDDTIPWAIYGPGKETS
ncbi:MAG: TIR domain-containing protein [Desulfobacterales bacterium]|nr:TIR domain-containing protein [Desulfobacterales bacterium]